MFHKLRWQPPMALAIVQGWPSYTDISSDNANNGMPVLDPKLEAGAGVSRNYTV